MHWDKALPAPGPPRPYQGVRVRDPVRELLRRKRGLEQQDGPGTAPPAVDASPHHNPSPYTPVSCSGFGVQSGAVDTGRGPGGDWAVQHQGAQPFQPPQFLQPAPAWCPVDCGQQHLPSAPGPPSYPGSRGLAGEVYMKTLGPSYALVGPPHTLLTYTHAPLLTGLGMEGPDAGLTYFPWGAPPLASISTLPPPAVQLAACSVPWPCSALVHRPLSGPGPGPGPGPVPGAFVSATLPKAEVFQEPERSVFPQPVREDPSPHRHHPDLEASMERAPRPLDHLVEQGPGPLDQLVEHAPGPLEHLMEQGPGPLDHLVEQGPGPLDHLVEAEVEQGPGPLDHLVEREMEPMNPLERLLEEPDEGGSGRGGPERFRSSLFSVHI